MNQDDASLTKLVEDIVSGNEQHNKEDSNAVLLMPDKMYVNMAKTRAIKIHIDNLFYTFGEEEVLRILIDQCKPDRK